MGFKDLSKLAKGLSGNINLDQLNLEQVITDAFISKNTKLDSVKAFVEKSGFNISSIADFKNLPMDKLDTYVQSISSFASWKEMLMKAVLKK